MSCAIAREQLSAAADGALTADEELTAHVAVCGACASYRDRLTALRRAVRYEAVDDVPDVAPAVLAVAAARRQRRRLQDRAAVAAAFVAALVAGAVFVGWDVREPPRLHAAVPDRVVAAQAAISSLSARLVVVERGWHPQVPERRYDGRLVYRAPESLALVLEDRTDYPDGRWVRNDVDVVADGPTWWARGPAPCPLESMPDCADPEPRVQAVTGREPFRDANPAPLDLVVPVQSFALGADAALTGERTIAGRAAFGVRTTAAQVQPLLDGFRQAGTLREVHPADPAEVWLDEAALVPLAVTVRAADDAERAGWAARHGHADAAGERVLEIRLADVTVNEPVDAAAFAPPPPGSRPRDAGFDDAAPVDVPVPGWLPEGMTLHRTGVAGGSAGAPRVDVAAWSDGRAWAKVRATGDWDGERLFGGLTGVVRRTALGDGVAYVAEGGSAVALHTAELDVVVTGSVPEDGLLRIAASLGLAGRPVPHAWPEADSLPVDEAVQASSGALLPPELAGFAPAAARIVDDTLIIAVAGPGARGFVLTQAPGEFLTPPLEPEVRGVEVRGVAGRYTPGTGELEWVEDGWVVSLRSTSLALEELVAIAERLEQQR